MIGHGVDGLIATTADEWEESLAWLIDHPQRRQWMAKALRRKVMAEHTLEKNVWKWPAAWERIIDASRQQRVRRLLAS